MSAWAAVILAGGQSKRWQGRAPKVLQPLLGRPLFEYSVAAAVAAGASELVIVASAAVRAPLAARLREKFPSLPHTLVVQEQALGTGQAALVGCAATDKDQVVVFYADTPLLEPERIRRLCAAQLTARAPTARSERADGEATPGPFVAGRVALIAALQQLAPDAAGEYALLDVMLRPSLDFRTLPVEPASAELCDINDASDLERAEKLLLERVREHHRRAGVTIRGDVYVDCDVKIEPDVTLEMGVVLRGATRIARGTRIDVGSVVSDSVIGEDVQVKPYCVISQSRIAAEAQVGPFAHLRPETELGVGAHIGNFVETKKTQVKAGAKANHLAYLGDGEIGERANIGAGTIFCNYDGYRKHKTVILADAFIGSDSQLVAPVTIGRGAYVATGTTVTQDVPDDALAIGRTRQVNKIDYAPSLRARLQPLANTPKK